MALNLILLTSARNNMMDEITALIDSGTAGNVTIYDGSQPADPSVAVGAQNALVIITLSLPSFAAASGGTIVGDITPALANTAIFTATATWFRIEDSAGNGIVDGEVGTSGSDLNLNTTSISSGVNVEITQLDLTAGNA